MKFPDESPYLDYIEERRLECNANVGFAAPLLANAAFKLASEKDIPMVDIAIALRIASGIIESEEREKQ